MNFNRKAADIGGKTKHSLAPAGPVPGTWSVYDADGNLCAAGYKDRGAAEMYAPPGLRGEFKFIKELAIERSDNQDTLMLALCTNSPLPATLLAVLREGIAEADAHVNNVALPTYSELLLAMRSLIAWVDSTGLVRMPAFAGMLTEPLDAARELVRKAGL